MRWVTESKRIKVQVDKILSFKSQVGKMKTSQITDEFIIISPSFPEAHLF